MKFRYVFMGLGSLLTLIVLFLTDPDLGAIQEMPFGANTLSILIVLLTSVFYIGMLYLGRKALFDYVDLYDVIKKATSTPEGAGLVVVGLGLFSISISIAIYAAIS